MAKAEEMRFIKGESVLLVHAKVEGMWRRKMFPPSWTVADVMARIGMNAEDMAMWIPELPPREMSKDERRLRHLLFMAHFGDGHEVYFDDGEMQCHTCGVDFLRDKVGDMEGKLIARHHGHFKKAMQGSHKGARV